MLFTNTAPVHLPFLAVVAQVLKYSMLFMQTQHSQGRTHTCTSARKEYTARTHASFLFS
uniref:Uncharacterized protein n=1 Tax=Arundo donax TaxID=35708 RepID=A0A0A9GCA1_ARUDO